MISAYLYYIKAVISCSGGGILKELQGSCAWALQINALQRHLISCVRGTWLWGGKGCNHLGAHLSLYNNGYGVKAFLKASFLPVGKSSCFKLAKACISMYVLAGKAFLLGETLGFKLPWGKS